MMVIVAVLGLGNLGGNIVGELAFHCQTVRAWDKNQSALDKLYSRIEHEKKNLKSDQLLPHADFVVTQNIFDIHCFLFLLILLALFFFLGKHLLL